MEESSYLALLFAVLFLVLNISLFPQGGHSGDLDLFETWGNTALGHGIGGVYAGKATDYPPLYIYMLELNALANAQLFRGMGIGSSGYNFLTKLIPVLCNLAIGVLVYLFVRPRSRKAALFCMGMYLFNPGLIYATAYWGQSDSVYTLFLFLSLIMLQQGEYVYSTLLFTLGFFTKIQSAAIFPVIATAVMSRAGAKTVMQALAYNSLLVLTILSPFILSGTLPDVLSVMSGSVGKYPYLSVNAYNSWFLLSPATPDWTSGAKDTWAMLGVPVRLFSIALLLGFAAFVSYLLFRRRIGILPAAASMALAFFMLPTEIHDRYLFMFFAFAAPLIVKRSYLYVYAGFSLTYLLNLMMVLGFAGKSLVFTPLKIILDMVLRYIGYVPLAIAVSIANIFLFIWFTKISMTGRLPNETP